MKNNISQVSGNNVYPSFTLNVNEVKTHFKCVVLIWWLQHHYYSPAILLYLKVTYVSFSWGKAAYIYHLLFIFMPTMMKINQPLTDLIQMLYHKQQWRRNFQHNLKNKLNINSSQSPHCSIYCHVSLSHKPEWVKILVHVYLFLSQCLICRPLAFVDITHPKLVIIVCTLITTRWADPD